MSTIQRSKTLFEEEANGEYSRYLGILAAFIDEEALAEEEVKDIIKKNKKYGNLVNARQEGVGDARD
jgi:hypothetical protein